jgi:DNA polymerase I-like protein with 3'-5' exonuclease and polymerase domains
MERMVSKSPCASLHVGWRGLMHVLFIPQHDEIIIEVRDGTEDQVQEIVKESMEEAFKQIIPEVPFLVEPIVAEAWD